MYTWKHITQVKNIRLTVKEKINTGNIDMVYLCENLNFNMNLSTFLALRNPVLNFLSFLGSTALLSYKPLSYT